jgi:hypothetical protein
LIIIVLLNEREREREVKKVSKKERKKKRKTHLGKFGIEICGAIRK